MFETWHICHSVVPAATAVSHYVLFHFLPIGLTNQDSMKAKSYTLFVVHFSVKYNALSSIFPMLTPLWVFLF